jgi:hypothetical protein
MAKKMKSNRLAWYEHVIRRDETHITLVEVELKKIDGLCEGSYVEW